MPKWKLTMEYDGSRYRGWQEQANARTVQGALRTAAEAFFETRIDLGGAGRTDAGVHALAQVVHLGIRGNLADPPTPLKLRHELNNRLPADINIRIVREAPDQFHARHNAIERYYIYQIATRRTAFCKPFVWWVKDRLDFGAIQATMPLFLGRHDFVSFCDPATPPTPTIVEVTRCEAKLNSDLILLRIGAYHFLWKMVRRIVGVLVEVGRKNLKPCDVERFLATPSNAVAQWTAPPSGLFLESVIYPGDAKPAALEPAVFSR